MASSRGVRYDRAGTIRDSRCFAMSAPRRVLLTTALALLLATTTVARAVEVFAVGPVPVDATAANAAAAREAARAEGQRKALRLLFERLTQASDWSRLPRLDGATVTNMVQ